VLYELRKAGGWVYNHVKMEESGMDNAALTPYSLKQVRFNNRIAMAPMVPFGWPQKDGVMADEVVQHYLRHANVQIGLLISQALLVTPEFNEDDRAGVYAPEHITNLRRITDECHHNGTRFMVQLHYNGFEQTQESIKFLNEYPTQKLQALRDCYIRSARLCKQAGCDGVELHGAHGFFLNLLASPACNHRADAYGGGLQGRLRLIREIAEGIRAFAGDDFIISYRMGWNDTLKTDVETAQALQQMGIEMLHISHGAPYRRTAMLPRGFEYNACIYAGSVIKKEVDVPVMVVNDIRTLRRAGDILEKGYADFTAFGKPFLADAKFLEKSLRDADYESCIRCHFCQWFVNGDLCPVRKMVGEV
jgi:2,4-dienoyl-CoA reductase-like NADH-dependent reductase (Old Yellow Enzyme family)